MAIFCEKSQKMVAPDPYGLWELHPQTFVCETHGLHQFAWHATQLTHFLSKKLYLWVQAPLQ